MIVKPANNQKIKNGALNKIVSLVKNKKYNDRTKYKIIRDVVASLEEQLKHDPKTQAMDKGIVISQCSNDKPNGTINMSYQFQQQAPYKNKFAEAYKQACGVDGRIDHHLKKLVHMEPSIVETFLKAFINKENLTLIKILEYNDIDTQQLVWCFYYKIT